MKSRDQSRQLVRELFKRPKSKKMIDELFQRVFNEGGDEEKAERRRLGDLVHSITRVESVLASAKKPAEPDTPNPAAVETKKPLTPDELLTLEVASVRKQLAEMLSSFAQQSVSPILSDYTALVKSAQQTITGFDESDMKDADAVKETKKSVQDASVKLNRLSEKLVKKLKEVALKSEVRDFLMSAGTSSDATQTAAYDAYINPDMPDARPLAVLTLLDEIYVKAKEEDKPHVHAVRKIWFEKVADFLLEKISKEFASHRSGRAPEALLHAHQLLLELEEHCKTYGFRDKQINAFRERIVKLDSQIKAALPDNLAPPVASSSPSPSPVLSSVEGRPRSRRAERPDSIRQSSERPDSMRQSSGRPDSMRKSGEWEAIQGSPEAILANNREVLVAAVSSLGDEKRLKLTLFFRTMTVETFRHAMIESKEELHDIMRGVLYKNPEAKAVYTSFLKAGLPKRAQISGRGSEPASPAPPLAAAPPTVPSNAERTEQSRDVEPPQAPKPK